MLLDSPAITLSRKLKRSPLLLKALKLSPSNPTPSAGVRSPGNPPAMKTLLIALVSATFATFASADDFRDWTQLATGKVISAKILDKKADNSAVRLTLKSGKTPWVQAKDLITEDRDFIENWVRMPLGFRFLSVTLSGMGVQKGGKKKINVVARAHDENLICTVYASARGLSSEEFEVSPGSTAELVFEVRHDYRVTIENEDGEIIDVETSRKKTRK